MLFEFRRMNRERNEEGIGTDVNVVRSVQKVKAGVPRSRRELVKARTVEGICEGLSEMNRKRYEVRLKTVEEQTEHMSEGERYVSIEESTVLARDRVGASLQVTYCTTGESIQGVNR